MTMRRYAALPLAGLLALAIAAPVAAGPNVHNASGSGETIYGEWFAEGTYGYVFLGQETGYGGFGELVQQTGEWVECDPEIGSYGFQGTVTWGLAYDVEITFVGRLDSGTATGQVELYTETVDECAGIYGGDPVVESGTLEVAVTGSGPIARFRGTGSYQIPSEFNGHQNYRGTERQATGSIVAGSSIAAEFEFGYLSQFSWMDHSNS